MKLKCSVDRVVQTIDSCIYIYIILYLFITKIVRAL